MEKRNIWVGKVLQKSGGSTETPRQRNGRFYCLFNAPLKNDWPEVMLPLSPVKLYFVLFQIFLEVDSFQPSPQLPLYFKAIKQWYAWAELVTDALTACDWCAWALSFLLTDPFTKSLIGDKFTCEFIIPLVVPEGFLNKQATKRILYS